MLTKIVELCNERGVIFSTRVSIDGVGEMHNEVRHVKQRRSRRRSKTIRAMQELQKKHSFNFGISTTIFQMNLDDAENILAWAKKEKLDIVFNMVRFTERCSATPISAGTLQPIGGEEERMRSSSSIASGRTRCSTARTHLHALRRHDRERLSPASRRARSRPRASC